MQRAFVTHFRRVVSLIGAAFLIGAPPVEAQMRAAGLNKNGALILIRSALLAIDGANKTGNYTVLRDLGAPDFQANTAAKLAEIFAPQRQSNLDLSGVAAIEPQLDEVPIIDPSGKLKLVGSFPSVSQQINFQLLFAPSEGQWKLSGVGVNIGQSGPAPAAVMPPPQAAAPAAAPPRREAKPSAQKPVSRREPKAQTNEPAE